MADAPKAGTLRVAPDLYAALAKAAKGAGVSATKLADQLLRDALDLPGGNEPARVAARTPSTRGPSPTTCNHPVSRRIGAGCAACGNPKAHAR